MPHIEDPTDVPIDNGTGLIYSVYVTPLIPRNSAGPGQHFRTLFETEVPVDEFPCVEVSGIINHHPGQSIAEFLDGLGNHPRARDIIVDIFCSTYRTEEDYSTEMLARVHIYTYYEDVDMDEEEEYEIEFESVVGLPAGDNGSRPRTLTLEIVTVGLDTEETSSAICLEEFSSWLEVIELPCSHVYHEHCIKRWFEKRLDCPLCRYELSWMP